MKDTVNILIVGVGGQGTILASDILTEAAMISGYDAKKSEIHGMSQRGGSVFSHVRYGKKVYSPVIPEGKANILLSLEEMETLRWLSFTGKSTKVVVADTRILPQEVNNYPEGIIEDLKSNFSNCYHIDTKMISEAINSPKTLNVTLLGIISNFIDLEMPAYMKAIESLVPKGTFEKNMEAFEYGRKMILS